MPNDLTKPLADRMRPAVLGDYAGQQHILKPGKPLYEAIVSGRLHSMIFWGPPGTGKTTLARIVAQHSNAEFIPISAVLAGVKEIRVAVAEAKKIQIEQHRRTILFVDEVHRFNKSQQDAFLPHVEDGTIYFIGATTENPSFALNNALLSRARVYVLNALTLDDLLAVLNRALKDADRGLGSFAIEMSDVTKQHFAEAADGDARTLLNLLEIAAELASAKNMGVINETITKEVLSGGVRRFDKQGEEFYNQISALHKSVRGSAPDASLYWLCRMIDGGCDLAYLARRMVRIASEDIGNADPYALTLAVSAFTAIDYIGMPEAQLILAQAATYLASCPKSNASYLAISKAKADVELTGELAVPLHLRNAPTKLMKQMDYGKDYKYSHDYEGHFAEQQYLPEELKDRIYYQPADIGAEAKIKERLNNWWKNKKR